MTRIARVPSRESKIGPLPGAADCGEHRQTTGAAVRVTTFYGSNCNVKLTATHRLKPSSSAKSHVGSITSVVSLQSKGPPTSAQNEVR
jgi:hypothetical protein